ncbi:MAG: prepilin peptidase [bacterium]|nr:prepilin peptidase [bacterium]
MTTTVILFVLGAVVGSFLNVVSLRWDKRNFGGRSTCPICFKTLHWFELVPILSFLIQKGKCRGCGAKISYQYPIVEILTGLMFVTVPYIFLPVFCIYMVIALYDLKHKVIPDSLVYVAIALSLIYTLFNLSTYQLMDLLAGPIIFSFFGAVWLLSRGRAMGFGDAKLGLSVGLLLGAAQGFSAIVLAFWIGAIVSVGYIFLHKIGFLKNAEKFTIKSEVPFAPFIIAGAWISLVLHLNILYVGSF